MNTDRNSTSSLTNEDWWAVLLGATALSAAVAGQLDWLPRPETWTTAPTDAMAGGSAGPWLLFLAVLVVVVSSTVAATGGHAPLAAGGVPVVFALAVVAQVIGRQETVHSYGLSYVLWALLLGLLAANLRRPPDWLRAGARTELYIKTGLVLLGAEILFPKMLALGFRGLGVAWLITPLVFVFMYFFGTRVLGLQSKPLTATISAATSVCGVSAAIAMGSATKARREEISFAISLTLLFTVAMMLLMPALAKLLGLSQTVAGAWIGGTVDSTGAVVASGALIGQDAIEIASVIKIIQNILIGVLAFVVAVLWVTRVERQPGEKLPHPVEIWTRFPKFIVGFILASIVFSLILTPALGEDAVAASITSSKLLRGWLFTLAFVSIGLESNFRDLAAQAAGGAPIVLYLVGQTVNIVLTLAAAVVFFG